MLRFTLVRLFWPLLALAILAMSGCGAYKDEKARFIGYNNGDDTVTVVVSGKDQVTIAPQKSQPFPVIIQVPRPRSYGGPNSPSTLDVEVEVTVAFRNLRTGSVVGPIRCLAGARIETTVVFDQLFGRDFAGCDWTRSPYYATEGSEQKK